MCMPTVCAICIVVVVKFTEHDYLAAAPRPTMLAAPIPANDKERLAALRALLTNPWA